MSISLLKRSNTQRGAIPLISPTNVVAAAAAVAVGSTVIGIIIYNWWRDHYKSKGYDDLFDDVVESPLFDPDVTLTYKKTSVKINPQIKIDNLSESGVLSAVEREKALNLAKELLRKLHGVNDDKNEVSEKENSDSDETDISLNYHIAKELEKEARDSLVEAVVQGEVLKMEAQGKSVNLTDYEDILTKAVEYLDISNEREVLRGRRIVMHSEGLHENNQIQRNNEISNPILQQRMMMDAAYAEFFSNGTELDRRLTAANDSNEDDIEERFEMNWGGNNNNNNNNNDYYDDDENEADLMAYLDQDDTAGYSNRMEARMGAMLEKDLRLLNEDAGIYDYGEGQDENEWEEEEDEEEEDLNDDLEKAEFERMLFNKLNELASSLQNGVTSSETTHFDQKNQDKNHSLLNNKGKKIQDESEDEWETEEDDNDDNNNENIIKNGVKGYNMMRKLPN